MALPWLWSIAHATTLAMAFNDHQAGKNCIYH